MQKSPSSARFFRSTACALSFTSRRTSWARAFNWKHMQWRRWNCFHKQLWGGNFIFKINYVYNLSVGLRTGFNPVEKDKVHNCYLLKHVHINLIFFLSSNMQKNQMDKTIKINWNNRPIKVGIFFLFFPTNLLSCFNTTNSLFWARLLCKLAQEQKHLMFYKKIFYFFFRNFKQVMAMNLNQKMSPQDFIIYSTFQGKCL